MDQSIEDILNILQENNELLHHNSEILEEILGHVRNVNSDEYRGSEDIKQLCINIISDILSERVLSNQDLKSSIISNFNIK
jgi:hypothetical protein